MGFIKNFLKKYAALLPPIGLLIVALLLVPPTLWIGGKVKAQMSASAGQAQTIRSLSADVPSREKSEQVKAYMDRLENEVQQISALMEQSSKRELISYNIFPKPTETSAQVFVQYGNNYRKTIEQMITGMNALDAPSAAEIRARTGSARPGAAGGSTPIYGTAGQRRTTAQDPMVDALCISRAESISVYAKPSALSWYDFWEKFQFEGTDSALQDCWNSQIGLWIYDDVVKTIQAMNVGSQKVSTSPVKRLLGVSFTGPVFVGAENQMGGIYMEMMMGMGGTPGMAGAFRDNLNYVTAMKPSLFVDKPWTGRVGGPDYDVIHFAVSVIIDNRYVLDFMREMCSEKEHTFREKFEAGGRVIPSRHNQITILQDAVYAVDKNDAVHDLYRYGNGAVMRLDLVCEYLLSRKGYDSIKPDPIKEQLGQKEGTDTTAPGMPGMGMPGPMM